MVTLPVIGCYTLIRVVAFVGLLSYSCLMFALPDIRSIKMRHTQTHTHIHENALCEDQALASADAVRQQSRTATKTE